MRRPLSFYVEPHRFLPVPFARRDAREPQARMPALHYAKVEESAFSGYPLIS